MARIIKRKATIILSSTVLLLMHDNLLIAYFSHHIQVQGNIHLDLFLFDPNSPCRCASEMKMVDLLIASGKQKFLIHPLIEIFVKLKWQKTWQLYFLYLFVFASFFFVLAGYAITHYGTFYKRDHSGYGYPQTGWW